ncbi:MAG: 3-dehydroquinate synthase [Thermoanaerobaculales bacterium]|jgi:3-dehydroquinate synthase|nr:3-dehydroquinate synthase [Thermoanaerobaculales bacterium]
MIRIELSSAHGDYAVLIGQDLLARLDEILRSEGLDHPRGIVTDATVGPLHGGRVGDALALGVVELPAGEPHKSWTSVSAICRRWLADRFDRGASVLAIGGGVVTDTVGFAAAVFLRGIAWVAAPTTLLGMVDAAIGGKTGVNLPEGKNLVGAFWPPRLVVADTATLATLPDRELRSGLAEVVKAAWIGDRGLLELLPSDRPPTYRSMSPEGWQQLVARSVSVKSGIVAADEREGGRRKALNLGHTLGHALEAATSYRRYLHGEAVAWGIEAEAVLARARGLLTPSGETTLRGALDRLGSRPGIADLDAEAVCRFIAVDKKRDAARVGWVLPTDDGVALDQRVETAEAVAAFRALQSAGDRRA